jgi:NUMOD3 motif/HNH endonuclease
MYLQNKYTRWYYNIVRRAQSRTLPADVYLEKHHIIPKSIGGDDTKNNLVSLTGKEHFVCHLLLVKMTSGLHKRSMAYAAWKMTHIDDRPRYTPCSRTYAYLKKQLSESYKGISKTSCYWLGKKHSNKTIELQSKIKQGKNNPNFGVTQKPEWNKKKSQAQKNIAKPKYICSVCNKIVGGKSNLDRWHGKNCSLNRV